jgi:multiple sugar transport system substrate-binding protein
MPAAAMGSSWSRWSRRRLVASLARGAAAPVAAAALAACGASADRSGTALAPDQKVTLTYWGTASDTTGAGQQLLQRFQQTYPNVTLDFSPTGNNNDKFTAAIAAGAPPDLYYQDRNWTAEFAAKGFTANLDEYVKKSRTVKPDDWWPKPKADVTWKGHVHAVPRHVDGRAFFWNKDVFTQSGLNAEQPPATWDALDDVIRRVYKAGADRIERLGFSPLHGNPPVRSQWLIFLQQLGADFLSADGNKVGFNNDQGIQALEWMVRTVDVQGGYNPINGFTAGLGLPTGQTPFSSGALVTQIHLNSELANLKKVAPQLRYGVGTIPLPKNGKRTTYQGGLTFAVPAGARQPAAGFALVEFYHQKDNQIAWAVDLGLIPVAKSVATSQEFLGKLPEIKPFVDEMPYGRWVPVTPGNTEMLDATTNWVTKALKKETSPREAINGAANEVQLALDKWKSVREGK